MYRRYHLPQMLTCLIVIGLCSAFLYAPARTFAATGCPTYHTQYDQLINGPANRIITARHRGNFTATLPENSLGAFIESFDRCQPHIETDVRTTKDGRLVVFHDVTVGKMLEPAYDPDTNTGPNARLADLTFKELRSKKLLTIDRKPTEYEVPTVEEVLRTLINRNAGSIISLEVKEPGAIIPTARVVDALARNNPTANLDKRVILKFTMDNFSSPLKWKQALEEGLVTTAIMADPVILPSTAAKIDDGAHVPETPGIRLTSNSERAVAAWAKVSPSVAPFVSVVLKDSSEFIQRSKLSDPTFGEVVIPANLRPDNAKDGTMARMHAIAKALGKKTEIFVPIPDYVMWRSGPVSGYTVPNTFGDHTPLNVREAFFNNTSSCCYGLADRRTATRYASEKSDLRGNLAWVFALEPTLITADDTDSVEVYAASRDRLNTTARPHYHRAEQAMESALAYAVDRTSPRQSSIVKLKGWNGGSSGLWRGQVCLRSANPEGYAWVVACNVQPSGGTTDLVEISVASRGKMRIRDTWNWDCLRWEPGETDVVYWSKNCSGPQAEWTRTANNRYLTGEGRALGFQWQDRYYWGVPYSYAVPTWDRSDWTQWTFR